MKRHTSQDAKQLHGEYFSTNTETLLRGFDDFFDGLRVVEPFAGAGDLASWALSSGAVSVHQYDIKPLSPDVFTNDSIKNPPLLGYQGIITNPPYLSKNKNKEKHYYEQWGQNDLYKCHLAAIARANLQKGIVILPSNFISESRAKARNLFFEKYVVTKIRYFLYPVFDDATTGICVVAFTRRKTPSNIMEVEFDICEAEGKEKKVTHTLHKENGWLVGKDFFDIINSAKPRTFKIARTAEEVNSNIIIGLLCFGKYSLGAHYNDGKPHLAAGKSFTTYQVILPDDITLTQEQQRKVVELYNKTLSHYRVKYDSLFLSNYLGADQKIKSRRYASLLLSWAISKIVV